MNIINLSVIADFTLKKYCDLLSTFRIYGYIFLTFEQYCKGKPNSLPGRFVILRHDVDKHIERAEKMAILENSINVKASYYMRTFYAKEKTSSLRNIISLGHEIGYHYEDITLSNGNMEKARHHFVKWLSFFRQFYPVRTICMHGSPYNKVDNRTLWNYLDYKQFGIIGEPYLDTDFNQIFYLTDTARQWDGYHLSIRDKIPQLQKNWEEQKWIYHSTDDIIQSLKNNTFPTRAMLTIHPQRWVDSPILWLWELIRQSVVNLFKFILIKCRIR